MKLERQLQRAKPVLLKALRLDEADFDFHLVSNKEMERIRAMLMARPDFKGAEARKIRKEEQVNVLAFPEAPGFPQPGRKRRPLGEVYLNSGYGNGDYATLGPLLVHGLLHLVGYRHYFERDRIIMQKLEQRLWEELISEIPRAAIKADMRQAKKQR